jgi:alpha-N-arabinofuranosidase
VNEHGVISLVVVNINESTDFEVDLASVGKEVEVYTITGKDVKAVNVEGEEQVGVKESKWDGQGKYKFAKHSMTLLRWSTGKKITEVVQGDGVRLDTRKLAWSA